MVYSEKKNISLYPDVLVIAEKPVYFDSGENFLINPILIIEVLSRSTRRYDLIDKFSIYKTIPTLKEYVTVDTRKYFVRTNFREEPNLWREEEYSDFSDSLILKSVGCGSAIDKTYKKVEFKYFLSQNHLSKS